MTPVEMFIYFILWILLAITLFILHRNSRLRRLRLPPGNLGLPFIGETLKLISAYKTENPEPFIDERVKRFGSLFLTNVFGEPTVFSVDPETNRFILQNEGKLFEASYPSSISNLLGKHSLVLMKGKLHRRMHAFTMSFANSPILRVYLFGEIDRLVRLNLDSWSDRVYLLEEAKKITFELTLKQLISFDPCEWTECLMKDYMPVIEGFFTVPFISHTYRKAIKARTKVMETLSVVVKQRREEASKGWERKNDMLGALLASGEGGVGESFSDEQIVGFLVSLLVAGYETTSTVMTLAVKFLTDTPQALAQLKDEHEQIRKRKGDSEALEWSDYKSMPFTQCVINETLRIANVIGGIFRRTTTDVHVGGYTIPKGWKVFVSFRGVHMHHDHFKDARTFSPWRWQNISGVTSRGYGNEFTPFGGGPRLCPGYEMARVAISVFFHHLVTRFSWTPAEEDKLVFFPTTRTQKRYPINVKHINRDEPCM